MIERIRGGWKNVPSHLRTKTQLAEEGLKPVGEACAEVWTSHQWVELYEIHNTVQKRVVTPKQLEALEKARKAAYRKYMAENTCDHCGAFVGREDLKLQPEGKKCSWCINNDQHDCMQMEAASLFQVWFDEDFVILDTETTNLDKPEIVEIGIIDKHGSVLYESLVRPQGAISEGANAVHGIHDEMLIDAPTWSECWDIVRLILRDRLVLCYNDKFDKKAIKNTCRKSGVKPVNLNTDCIMNNYRRYMGYKKWLSLSNASGQTLGHRAIGDCNAARGVILSVWKELGLL